MKVLQHFPRSPRFPHFPRFSTLSTFCTVTKKKVLMDTTDLNKSICINNRFGEMNMEESDVPLKCPEEYLDENQNPIGDYDVFPLGNTSHKTDVKEYANRVMGYCFKCHKPVTLGDRGLFCSGKEIIHDNYRYIKYHVFCKDCKPSSKLCCDFNCNAKLRLIYDKRFYKPSSFSKDEYKKNTLSRITRKRKRINDSHDDVLMRAKKQYPNHLFTASAVEKRVQKRKYLRAQLAKAKLGLEYWSETEEIDNSLIEDVLKRKKLNIAYREIARTERSILNSNDDVCDDDIEDILYDA